MKIKSWSVSNHQLAFVVETNGDVYPSCQLNGVSSNSKEAGYYLFRISPRKSYKLVCNSVFDTKVYRIQQTFVSPGSFISLRSVFFLVIVVALAGAVALNYSSVIVALE